MRLQIEKYQKFGEKWIIITGIFSDGISNYGHYTVAVPLLKYSLLVIKYNFRCPFF